MNKRAIAILGAIFILIVGALGFLIYSRSKSNKEPQPVTNVEPTPTVVETPPVQEDPPKPAGAVRLTDDAITAPILFYNGNGISYFNASGQLFQTELQVTNGSVLLSNKKELSIAQKPNISKVLWPAVGNNFIAQFGTDSKPSWSAYINANTAYSDIPSQVYSLDWMPSGDKIMFVWIDGNGKATLNIGNPDTSGYQTLTDLYEPDNIIDVSPDGSQVAFYRTQTTDISRNNINIVSANGKTFKPIVKDGYNMGVLWSPDSTKFLFTKRDTTTQKFGLWMTDIATGEIRSLNVATTVDKAVWSKDSQSVYAGVPTTGVAGQGLTQDNLVRIEVSSAQQQTFEAGIAVDARDLFLNSTQDVLFFRNAQDNALYYISIK